MGLKNLEQSRLLEAYKKLEKTDKEYGNWVKKLPALVQANGVIYTLLALENKCKKLYDDIQSWLKENADLTIHLFRGQRDFNKIILGLSQTNLRLVTMEVLAFARAARPFVKK